jgi:hypothetical protein
MEDCLRRYLPQYGAFVEEPFFVRGPEAKAYEDVYAQRVLQSLGEDTKIPTDETQRRELLQYLRSKTRQDFDTEATVEVFRQLPTSEQVRLFSDLLNHLRRPVREEPQRFQERRLRFLNRTNEAIECMGLPIALEKPATVPQITTSVTKPLTTFSLHPVPKRLPSTFSRHMPMPTVALVQKGLPSTFSRHMTIQPTVALVQREAKKILKRFTREFVLEGAELNILTRSHPKDQVVVLLGESHQKCERPHVFIEQFIEEVSQVFPNWLVFIEAPPLENYRVGLTTAATVRLGGRYHKGAFSKNVTVVPIDIREMITKVAPKYNIILLYQLADYLSKMRRFPQDKALQEVIQHPDFSREWKEVEAYLQLLHSALSKDMKGMEQQISSLPNDVAQYVYQSLLQTQNRQDEEIKIPSHFWKCPYIYFGTRLKDVKRADTPVPLQYLLDSVSAFLVTPTWEAYRGLVNLANHLFISMLGCYQDLYFLRQFQALESKYNKIMVIVGNAHLPYVREILMEDFGFRLQFTKKARDENCLDLDQQNLLRYFA